MNIPAFMLYGDPAELSEYLIGDRGGDLSKDDLSAALANALDRIATLERGLAALRPRAEGDDA